MFTISACPLSWNGRVSSGESNVLTSSPAIVASFVGRSDDDLIDAPAVKWVRQLARSPRGDALDRLRSQAVEGVHRELEVLLLRVLQLRVRQAAQALDEEHHRRDSRTRDLRRVVERSARQAVRCGGDLAKRFVGELD